MLVVWFPDRDDERVGVIRTIFMNDNLIHRPTSGATADELAAQLCNVRTCTRRVTDDLSMQQLMGPMLPIVNPILWEIGHVGWFHEYWTLRHAHGGAPILDRADRLWNSSTVAHATRSDMRGRKVLGVRQRIAPARGEATSRCPAGAGGSARPPPMASSSTMRSGPTRSRSRRSGLPRPPSRTPSSPLS